LLASVAAILAFATACVVALIAVPIAARVARRTGFLDQPVGYKRHGHPTPYLGGSAVVLAFVVVAIAFGAGSGRFLAVVLGAVALWVVGTIDDRVNLSPLLRVGVTIAAAVGLWAEDLGWNVFDAAALDLGLTIVWVVGLVNAFNLMDNLDGATGSVAAASSVGIGAFALVNDDAALAALSFGLVGACLGLLRSNLARPARIFLGDGGSMPVGFVIAAMAIAAPRVAEMGNEAVLIAALLTGLVILDTTLVVISRRRHGVPLLTGGRDHLTHRLLGIVGSARRVAGTLATAQLGLCALALAAASLGRSAVLAVAILVGAAGLGAIAWLERRMDRHHAEASTLSGNVAPARE